MPPLRPTIRYGSFRFIQYFLAPRGKRKERLDCHRVALENPGG